LSSFENEKRKGTYLGDWTEPIGNQGVTPISKNQWKNEAPYAPIDQSIQMHRWGCLFFDQLCTVDCPNLRCSAQKDETFHHLPPSRSNAYLT
jgi:hypothetical protein